MNTKPENTQLADFIRLLEQEETTQIRQKANELKHVWTLYETLERVLATSNDLTPKQVAALLKKINAKLKKCRDDLQSIE